MPVDPNALVEAVVDGLSKIPSGIFAALLLAGPTAVWLILRLAKSPDARSRFGDREANLHWVCAGCRSLNEDRASSCYRCSMARTDAVLPLIAAAAAVDAAGVGVAVGPGRPAESLAPAPAPSWLGLGDADDDHVADGDHVADEDLDRLADPVPAFAGEPSIIEPQPKVARRRSSRSRRD